jgi:hypothetical protein
VLARSFIRYYHWLCRFGNIVDQFPIDFATVDVSAFPERFIFNDLGFVLTFVSLLT